MAVVTLSDDAIEDLAKIGVWIAGRAGRTVANSYVDRIEAACWRLSDYPRRGTPRDDLAPSLRTITFERRIVIAYRIDADAVRILRVIHNARDWPPQFMDDRES